MGGDLWQLLSSNKMRKLFTLHDINHPGVPAKHKFIKNYMSLPTVDRGQIPANRNKT
jgi:hypothetical protein